MDKPSLINKIKSLDGLANDEKADLIQLLNETKQYGLVWEDKPEDVERELLDKLPVLVEVTERRILAKDLMLPVITTEPTLFDGTETPEINMAPSPEGESRGDVAPNHILIEGDNLHALTALTFTHEGKIDVIYIDPPYNTGQADEFRYNDVWILKENPFRHSAWLSFISKRLKIAKRLLNEKGVIIIHIDENEFDALNLLLESEIFSEESFLGVIVWNKQNPKGDAKGVASMHEYLLIYAKNKFEFTSLENALMRPKPNALKILNKAKRLFQKLGKIDIPEEIKEVIKPFNFAEEILNDFKVKYDLELINKEFQSWINRQDFSGGELAYKMIDHKGIVYQSVSMAWPNKEKAPEEYFRPLIHPTTLKACPVPARGWRNPPKTMDLLLNRDLVIFGIDERTQPRRKYLLHENLFENTPSIYNNGSSDDDLFKEIGINFPYPKPVEVATYFLKSVHPNPNIILDFFAGSGTTLHATMVLNNEDNSFRQSILVTDNENNIADEVCYERNKRIIKGYTNKSGAWVDGLTRNNLRYYKTAFVSREKTTKNKKQLTRQATELLCIKEDIYTELAAINDFKLNNRTARCFADHGRYMMVIYDEEIIEKLIPVIAAIETKYKLKVYVFAPGQYPFTEEFEEVLHKVELGALPDAIYKAYMSVLPKKSDRRFAAPLVTETDLNETTTYTDPDLFTETTNES